jgi:hypothetical protein
LVRYVRRCIRDGRIKRPDVLDAIQIRLAHLVAGGYQRQERRIALDVREAVIARDKGCCCICGKPGTEIDHMEGSSGRPENLQLLCHTCHIEKTRAKMVQVDAEDEHYETVNAKAEAFWERVESKHPTRICDDEKNWKGLYRTLMAQCRQALSQKRSSRAGCR